jgi:predicted nucleic acid-binding protein
MRQTKIIVDANIVFSGILNSNGKIGDLLINSENYFNFIAPEFLHTEIRKHYSKLTSLSGLSLEQIQEAEFFITRNLTFISEEQISKSAWKKAIELVSNIDPNDAPYIAYCKHFKCKLWSGDKQLIKGLSKKGFSNIFSTEELFQLRESKRK